MTSPAVQALFVCALLVGGASVAITAQPSPVLQVGSTPGEGPGLTVEGDAPGVDVNRTYRRVAELYGSSGPKPNVTLRRDDGVNYRSDLGDEFFGAFADQRTRIERPVGGAGSPDDVTVSFSEDASSSLIEQLLAHEFGHAFQPPDLRDDLRENGGERAGTMDALLAQDAIEEGAATFVADEYTDRYLPETPTESERIAAEWDELTDGTRLLWAPYFDGARYVHATIDSPADLSSVYRNPPSTTEQVLHPDRNESDPRPLRVESDGPEDWSVRMDDSMGELYLRTLLESELPEEDAERAADGWGNDRLLTYSGDEADSYLWVLRWDDPDDADRFEDAITSYLDEIATREGAGWSDGETTFRRGFVTDETTYVAVGNTSFVDSIRVEGSDSEVVVSGGGQDERGADDDGEDGEEDEGEESITRPLDWRSDRRIAR